MLKQLWREIEKYINNKNIKENYLQHFKFDNQELDSNVFFSNLILHKGNTYL